jgi:hypothetical protein
MAKITMDTPRSRFAAFTFAAAMSGIGVIAWLCRKPSFPFFFFASGASVICGLLFPRIAGMFFAGIQFLLRWLGVFMLAAFYFLVVTPWALVYRLVTRTKRETAQSYWFRRPADRRPSEQYERQW